MSCSPVPAELPTGTFLNTDRPPPCPTYMASCEQNKQSSLFSATESGGVCYTATDR